MKKIAIAVVGIIATALVTWQVSSAQEHQAATFEIVLESSASGWTATCARGCNWTRLSFDCPADTCRSRLDQHGVQGLPPRD